MKNTLPSFRLLLAGGMLALFANTSAYAQLVNFQAATYTGGTTWTDTEGLNATYVGGTAAVANGTSVTTNGGFTFDAQSAGITNLTSYTIAVGFTATSIANNGFGFYGGGDGIVGSDIGGAGQGDPGMSLGNAPVQLMAGSGANDTNPPGTGSNGNDVTTYATQGSGNYGGVGVATGAVLVANGSGGAGNGTLTLYVNGVQTQQATGLTINPIGLGAGGPSTVGDYQFGIGTTVAYGGALNGDITQMQIYGTAFNTAAAETLSNEILLGSSVPEPSTYALMVLGVGMLVWVARRRSMV